MIEGYKRSCENYHRAVAHFGFPKDLWKRWSVSLKNLKRLYQTFMFSLINIGCYVQTIVLAQENIGENKAKHAPS